MGAIKAMAASSYEYVDDDGLQTWLSDRVLGIAELSDSLSADVSPESFADALRSYAKSLSERLHTIEVVGQSQRKNIEDIYMPLRLQPLAAERPRLVSTLIGLLTAGQEPKRLFVIGTPGAGKSTLLSYTVFQLANLVTKDPSQPYVPVLMRAKDLAELNFSSVMEYVRSVIKGYVKIHGNEVSSTITYSEGFGGSNTSIFIDGVDELRPSVRRYLRQLVRRFETEHQDVNIVLCARNNGYDPELWEGYSALLMLPLEVLSVRHYVEKFAPAENRERLLTLLTTSERLRELAQVPFMLALMCSYEESSSPLPMRRARLIEACVKSLLKRRAFADALGLDREQVEKCLTNVSERLFRLNSSGGHSQSEFLFAVEMFLADRPMRHLDDDRHEIASLALDEIIERTGLLQRDGDEIDFVHRSIWEYFVGVALANRGVDAVDGLAGSPVWEEPIRLMVGLAPEPRVHQLLTKLWSIDPSLALRSASETPFNLQRRVRQLVGLMAPGEVAGLVRDLGVVLDDRSAQGASERLVLDTLGVLLPEARSCEVLWEALNVLLRVRDRGDEARTLLFRVFRFDEASARLEEVITNGQAGLHFVKVSGGDFEMGSGGEDRSVDEGPEHRVRIDSFEISNLQVTNAIRQFFPFDIGIENDSRSPTPAHPIIGVTWFEAAILALWLGCRLPTEAEWEFACRAGGTDDYTFFDEVLIPEYAWYAGNARNMTHPVGTLSSNSIGLHDMLGNVREWCSDWFGATYYSECLSLGLVINPRGPLRGTHRVLRGGCFDWNTANLVPTYRNYNLPNNRGFQNGVRLVRGMPDFLAGLTDLPRRHDQHPD